MYHSLIYTTCHIQEDDSDANTEGSDQRSSDKTLCGAETRILRLCSIFVFGCNPLKVFVHEGKIP